MLSSFSVKKPFTVIVAVIVIAILGAVSLTNMTPDLFPSINLPYAVVSTTYIGASPEEVELAVTKPIEQSMASISNIKSVRSVSREHMSMVILEFTQTANMDSAIIEMRESLDMIKGFMPEEVGSPIILKLNPDMMPIMILSASVEGQKISESSQFLEKTVIPELESVEGVASVSPSGLIESQIHVILRDEKISEVTAKLQAAMMASMQASAGTPAAEQNPETAALNPVAQIPDIQLTREMVAGILKGQNFSMPAGYVANEGVDYLVRTGDKIKDLDELKKLTVFSLPVPGMTPVVLEDVADIVTVDNSSEMYAKVNGNDAVILSIQKQTEYATANVAESMRAKMNSIMEKHEGVELTSLMDQGEYINIVVDSIIDNLIIGGILAILILIVFLRDFKPTLVVGLAIPISLVAAFVMMYLSGITLNIVSMGGLALGVGMLVDNSIVVIENIYRMRNEGVSAREAAIKGAKQVAGAITASTLTTVAVFIPIVFTQGITRQIFSDMGLTIAYSLIASLLVALTLVPMMASGIMAKNTQKEHKAMDAFLRVYTRVLNFSLRHKLLVIVIIFALFAGSIVGAVSMGTEFFPAANANELSVNITMPEGTAFEDTVTAADKVTAIISEIEDVETVGAFISGGGMLGMGMMGGSGSSKDAVSMYVLLKDQRTGTSGEIAQTIREKTSDLGFEVKVNDAAMDMTALAGGSIAINIRGKDLDTLERIAGEVAVLVSGIEGTVEVSDGLDKTSPEIKITVDKTKSINYGLTVAQVFMEISKYLKEDEAATSLSIGAKDYDILVKDENSAEKLTLDELREMLIETPQGQKVAVKEIASVGEAIGFSAINRQNQERYVTVTGEVADGYNIGKVNEEIQKKIAEYNVPEGYFIDIAGENEMTTESFKDLFLMLAMAVVFIYLIMVAQFQSLLSPFIVMFTIPLAFTGGFFGLMIAGKPLSIVAFIGLIILSGVVVNNGIVFVDYINQLRAEGVSKKDAIVWTGNIRMRPILMTALTTIISLSTMMIGVGTGTELIQPMAITAVGGLIYATLLTLIFIPVLYDVFHRKEKAVVKDVV